MTIPFLIQNAIQAFYAERATADDIAALEDWLRKDIAHVRLFAELGMFEWQMLCEQEKADAAVVLATLREAEAQAQAEVITLDLDPIMLPEEDQNSLSSHEIAAVGGYLLHKAVNKQTLSSKPAKIAYAAAIVLLATALFVLWGPWGPAGNDPVGVQPLANLHQPERVTIASLTVERDAQWHNALGAVTPLVGDALRSGDKLVLTKGYAEITTQQGAVAVLEAPCTVELTDRKNALILHSGRLLGICRTESSKGFVVETHYAEVRDLGTEFGVHAQPGKVTATVFTGKVEMTPDGGETRPLSKNQTARLDTEVDAQAFVVEDQVAAGFGTLRTRPALPPAQRWQEHLAELDRSHGLIGQLSFDETGVVATPGTGATFDAKLVGGTIVPGDEAQGAAASLLINDNSHGVDLIFDPKVQHKQLTLVSWARVNQSPGQEVAALFDLTSASKLAKTPVWHIHFWEQAVYTGQRVDLLNRQDQTLRANKKHKLFVAPLDDAFQGQWRCYAVALDADTQAVEHYLDGKHLGSYKSLMPGAFSMEEMRFGAVVESLSTNVNKILHINGDCGLFLVFDQALSDEQIRLLHMASAGQFLNTP